MQVGLGFIVQAIRLSEGFLVLMTVCSVRSSCVL